MKAGISSLFMIAAGPFFGLAEEVTIKVEKAMVITFPSQDSRAYKLLGTENAEGPWRSLQDGITGNGGEVTIFYKSESDQKLFFKVETSEGSPAQKSLLSVARLNLSELDFTGYQLPGHELKLYELSGAIFDQANLAGANLIGAVARKTSFRGADLRGIISNNDSVFGEADFSGANLEGTRFSAAHMGGADFRNAKLKGVVFTFTGLAGANFSGQSLSNVAFRFCDLYFADLSGTDLAGAVLVRSYLRYSRLDGAKVANANLEGTILVSVPLTGRDLRGTLMRGVAVQSSDWSGVNAPGVDGSLAYVFHDSSFSGANFTGGNLEAAVLNGVNLTGANLQNTKLQGAELKGANLSNVNFTGADLSFAELQGASLTGATGFDAEQAGMDFGTGATLPDGTTRAGRNPGLGLAPASAPGRLRFEINDLGAVSTRELTFSGSDYSEPGQPGGTFSYSAKGMIAVLALPHPAGFGVANYTLLFTSPTGGKVFQNSRGGTAGVFRIGTFTTPQ